MSGIYALGTFARTGGDYFVGILQDGRVLALHDALADAPADLGAIVADWDRWGSAIDAAVATAPADGWEAEAALTALLPYMPDNIYGAGANYRRHVIELIVDKGVGGVAHLSPEERRKHGEEIMDRRAATGKPFIYVGARASIGSPDQPLVLPYDVREPDWELELAVVIGRPARRVSRADALGHVAGYMIANDFTARELVDRPDIPQMGMDWMACKGLPGFKLLGPYITPGRFIADPQKLHMRLSVNGDVMQDEGTDDMIFDVARLIEYLSAHTRLLPGDVILTGSPSGNGTHYDRFLRDGDEVVGEISGLVGKQRVRCEAERAPG
ncbi:fumarylacetoacetate hydrolase family protein [Sphingobium sp. HWE2-09]|uniref:fumarylacetoacetate hydrolase family protein n=1 Tax=Sphingobium sp. HWE2-09 TaxID=3108390 RepID=UPI002DC905D8|nr:fumarylacetoacetate hydrolase family protein [Sphingobium sp. HWE2-09]